MSIFMTPIQQASAFYSSDEVIEEALLLEYDELETEALEVEEMLNVEYDEVFYENLPIDYLEDEELSETQYIADYTLEDIQEESEYEEEIAISEDDIITSNIEPFNIFDKFGEDFIKNLLKGWLSGKGHDDITFPLDTALKTLVGTLCREFEQRVVEEIIENWEENNIFFEPWTLELAETLMIFSYISRELTGCGININPYTYVTSISVLYHSEDGTTQRVPNAEVTIFRNGIPVQVIDMDRFLDMEVNTFGMANPSFFTFIEGHYSFEVTAPNFRTWRGGQTYWRRIGFFDGTERRFSARPPWVGPNNRVFLRPCEGYECGSNERNYFHQFYSNEERAQLNWSLRFSVNTFYQYRDETTGFLPGIRPVPNVRMALFDGDELIQVIYLDEHSPVGNTTRSNFYTTRLGSYRVEISASGFELGDFWGGSSGEAVYRRYLGTLEEVKMWDNGNISAPLGSTVINLQFVPIESDDNNIGTARLIDIFEDSNLAQAVARHLTLYSDDEIGIYDEVDIADLQSITYLDLRNSNIEDINGIEVFINLTNLILSGNEVNDITPLTNLFNLTHLNLNFTEISDISALGSLTTLTTLDLWWNNISNINALANLTNLVHLDLRGNEISNLSPLTNLTDLYFLNLNDNNITDVNPLSNLIEVRRLYISVNHISDVSPLANLINLRSFTLNENYINDISPLINILNNSANLNMQVMRQTINLEATTLGINTPFNLRLPDGRSVELTSESGFTFEDELLTWLQIGEHSATWTYENMYVMEGYGSTLLRFSGTVNQIVVGDNGTIPPSNQIRLIDTFECNNLAEIIANILNVDIEDYIYLSDLEDITFLHVQGGHHPRINSLNGIEHLTGLTRLVLQDHLFGDISPLANLIGLEELTLARSLISDITALSGLINLVDLRLHGNNISDLRPLSNLINLENLALGSITGNYISGNRISDLTPLVGLINLERLNVIGNCISDFSPLDNLVENGLLILGMELQNDECIIIDEPEDDNGTGDDNGDTDTGEDGDTGNNNDTDTGNDNGTDDDASTGNNDNGGTGNNNNRPTLPQTGVTTSSLPLIGILLLFSGFLASRKKLKN